MEKVLFFCAHNDDQVIGAGGTIAKYASEGKEITTVIFSYGEKSHPWMKPEYIISTRIKETEQSNKILRGKEIIFLDLKEGQYLKDYEEKKYEGKLVNLIKKTKPSKIFYHSADDHHPDHKVVNKIVNELLDKMKYKGDVYTFDVWTPIIYRKRNIPKMVVDITSTFKTKIKAFKVQKSQKMAILSLLWSIYLKAFLNGLNYGCKYAETFKKVK